METEHCTSHTTPVNKFLYNSPISNLSACWVVMCAQSDTRSKYNRYIFATSCCKHAKNGFCYIIQHAFLYLMFSFIFICQSRNGYRYVRITSRNNSTGPKRVHTRPWLTVSILPTDLHTLVMSAPE